MNNIIYKIGVLFLFLWCNFLLPAQEKSVILGKIVSTDDTPVEFAVIYLKETQQHTLTNEKGVYSLYAVAGKYTVRISMLGYQTQELKVNVKPSESLTLNVVLKSSSHEMDEVVVTSQSNVKRISESAYNAVAINAKSLHNSTQDLASVLGKASGVKLRESGGVGSDIQLSLDGFAGKHVKLFIDGVPQEGVGSSFSLNNIPVNFAERIEIYKGVVPVGFGADALGGVVNIVTNKRRRNWFVDASYSYGSFNTHKSSIHAGQRTNYGFVYELNAFQNYSDNNYSIDTPVEYFNADGTTSMNAKQTRKVKRFHDTYHNEAIIAKVGIVDKKFADRLLLTFTYSKFGKEIQTGVLQKVVFGEKLRKGYNIMPSLEYSKRNLFTKGFDVILIANANDNITRNIDTATFRFNWLGEKKYLGGQAGEQAYQNSEFRNRNLNLTFTTSYHINQQHLITLNHIFNAFHRNSRSDITSSISDNTIAKETMKNISGLSYRYAASHRWNLSVFGKYYHQFNAGPISTSTNGVGNYIHTSATMNTFGYGSAGTFFIIKPLQLKLSYENACRLPTIDELFGDEDLEIGQITLKPETSHNINVNLSYDLQLQKHGLYAEVGLIYRNTKDYIRRRIDSYSGNRAYASYENHGRVITKGVNVAIHYNYSHWISVGGVLNYMDARNYERYVDGTTQQQSLTYKARIPNQPYFYTNADLSFHWQDAMVKGNVLTFTYGNIYTYTFPLYWENLGNAATKESVPSQLSHNIALTYSMANGRYNLSVECRNLTNEKLYDNFSLQKAGRAFYGKIRIYFGN